MKFINSIKKKLILLSGSAVPFSMKLKNLKKNLKINKLNG